MRSAIVAVALASALSAAAELAWAAPETIDIHNGAFTLHATLFKPEGAGPFPAVVGLYSCEGLNNGTGGLANHFRDWGERLNKAGFVLLVPDSFGSRNVGPQCRTARTTVRTDRERVEDAQSARVWLQNQSYVKPDHISLIGWSDGGISVLWTVRSRAHTHDNKLDFRSAIAFYPGCRRLDTVAWAARVPTLILSGGADDVVSYRACEQMVAGARGRSARVQMVVYPGAYHDFDRPNRTLQQRSGYAFSTDGSGKIHTGTNPGARADALRRVPQWLAR